MPRHADEATALRLPVQQEVLTQLIVGLTTGLRNGLVPLGLGRPEESISLSVEILAEDISHPFLVRPKPVVMVTPFAQLNGIEDACLIQDAHRCLIIGLKNTRATLQLHAPTIGRIEDDWPPSAREHLEGSPGTGRCGRSGIQRIGQPVFGQGIEKRPQLTRLGRPPIDGKMESV